MSKNTWIDKVFVYGTLKEWGSLYLPLIIKEVLEKKDTIGNYSIYKTEKAPFPFLKEDRGGLAYGEVHQLSHPSYLQVIDHTEGVMYSRRKIITSLGHEAWVYIYRGGVLDMEKVEGFWEEERKKKEGGYSINEQLSNLRSGSGQ